MLLTGSCNVAELDGAVSKTAVAQNPQTKQQLIYRRLELIMSELGVGYN